MSKKHPGKQPWFREKMQLGRRRQPGAEEAEVPQVDARKPPGWQGRKATREAKQGKRVVAEAPPVPAPASTPAVKDASKPAVVPQGAKHGARNGAPHAAPQAAKAPKPAKSGKPIKPAAAHAPVLDGEGRAYITLVQFLKTIAAVGTGGAGKHAIRAGGMLVNGVEELRPGRKLHAGDVVVIEGSEHKVEL